MDKALLSNLRKAVQDLANALDTGVEASALIVTAENKEIYGEFGKKNSSTAFQIFKELLYSGCNITLNIFTILNRSRSCDFNTEEVGFWQDLAVIVDLYEYLESNGFYVEEKNLIQH